MLPFVLAVYSIGSRAEVQGSDPFSSPRSASGFRASSEPNPTTKYRLLFSFAFNALKRTAPFYAHRFLMFPLSGFPACLAFIRDRRIWFGLLAMVLVMVPLLFLPGAVRSLCVSAAGSTAIAMAAAASRWNPVWAGLPLRSGCLSQPSAMACDEGAQNLHSTTRYSRLSTQPKASLRGIPPSSRDVYGSIPLPAFTHGAPPPWSIAHHQINSPAFFVLWPEGKKALGTQTVAFWVVRIVSVRN